MPDSLEEHFLTMRREMVQQIALHAAYAGQETGRPELDDRVMAVLAEVPRHEFVPSELQLFAYLDTPLPIGCGKTISQPFMVALMTDLLDLKSSDRVLEIGTGLGYQAAVLSQLVNTVYTVEIIEELSQEAAKRISKLGYTNIRFRIGDGSNGWPEFAPFDKIVVTAAPELIPPSLLNQLVSGGRMLIPAGMEDSQQLMLAEKDANGRMATQEVLAVRFARMVTSH